MCSFLGLLLVLVLLLLLLLLLLEGGFRCEEEEEEEEEEEFAFVLSWTRFASELAVPWRSLAPGLSSAFLCFCFFLELGLLAFPCAACAAMVSADEAVCCIAPEPEPLPELDDERILSSSASATATSMTIYVVEWRVRLFDLNLGGAGVEEVKRRAGGGYLELHDQATWHAGEAGKMKIRPPPLPLLAFALSGNTVGPSGEDAPEPYPSGVASGQARRWYCRAAGESKNSGAPVAPVTPPPHTPRVSCKRYQLGSLQARPCGVTKHRGKKGSVPVCREHPGTGTSKSLPSLGAMSADSENAAAAASEAADAGAAAAGAAAAGSADSADTTAVAEDATTTEDVKIVVASQDDEVEEEQEYRGRTVRESYSEEEIRIISEQQEEDDLYVRKWLFFAICCLEMLANFDSGVIPATIPHIMRVFDMTYVEVGLLGSLTYIG